MVRPCKLATKKPDVLLTRLEIIVCVDAGAIIQLNRWALLVLGRDTSREEE